MDTAPYTVRGVITDHYRTYAARRRLRADVINAAERIIRCRTASLGEYTLECECGHVRRTQYRSCRHRCCPQCRGGRRAQWLEQTAKRLLPCDHVHVIFTVPDTLNRLWQFNRSLFAALLMTAAREALTELLEDPKYLGATPGILSVLHTWGRNLSIHPHVHCLVTAGGLSASGEFRTSTRKALLPAKVLMQVFRGKFRASLLEALAAERLRLPPDLSVAKCRSRLNRCGVVDWNVRVEERVPSGVPVAGYLARYLTGGPMSDRRLVSVSAEEVVFQYRDFRDGSTRPLRLTPEQFLDRWFEHVPPKGLRTVRYAGLYANCHQATRARLCAEQKKGSGLFYLVD